MELSNPKAILVPGVAGTHKVSTDLRITLEKPNQNKISMIREDLTTFNISDGFILYEKIVSK